MSRVTNKKLKGATTPTEDDRKRFQSAWKLIAWLHGINATFFLLTTSYIVYFYIHHPLIGTLSEMHAVIVWLKTASYAFTNRDLRHAYLHPSSKEEDELPEIYSQCPYPQNITLGNLTYFWWAPTLVYQPVYPRTAKIRWVFVAKRVGEALGLSAFMWVASAQYAAPLLRNSVDKMASFDLPAILERLMKLSTISLVVWLAGFFALFQSSLNALAEVTRFGDREFYTDWWNSSSLGTYWRSWNKPVYQFMKRHVYSPLIGRGWKRGPAGVFVFIFSGILHELLVGVPTHNIIGTSAPSLINTKGGGTLLTDSRCCFYWHGCTVTSYRHHSSTGENEGNKRKGYWQLHFLDFVYSYRPTIGSPFVFLCLASKIWKCE